MKKKVYENPIINVFEKVSESLAHQKKIVTLESSNWVNMIPLTDQNQIVFVKQFRYGTESETLEIPGGMIDNNEMPKLAALRELYEETGYHCDKVIELGNISPNPALFNNRVFTFFGKNAYLKNSNIENQNEISEVVLINLDEVPRLIKLGKIDHALVIAAFFLLDFR